MKAGYKQVKSRGVGIMNYFYMRCGTVTKYNYSTCCCYVCVGYQCHQRLKFHGREVMGVSGVLIQVDKIFLHIFQENLRKCKKIIKQNQRGRAQCHHLFNNATGSKNKWHHTRLHEKRFRKYLNDSNII